jgi:hypothetical protein
VAATAQAIKLAKHDDKHRFMHAFPDVDNAPSTAICHKLGLELVEVCEFEFPKGHDSEDPDLHSTFSVERAADGDQL